MANWANLPILQDTFNTETFLLAVDRRNRYHITEAEKNKIQAYSIAEVNRIGFLSFEVRTEIDKNIQNKIETKTHLKNYLQSIIDKMYYVLDTLRRLNYIDELEKVGSFFYHDAFSYTQEQMCNSQLLVDYFQANLKNYYSYNSVLTYAISCQTKHGIHKKDLLNTKLECNVKELKKISDPYLLEDNFLSHASTSNFEDMFYNISNAEACLGVLKNLDKPSIDGDLNYIGKNKGIFPLWINILLKHSPKPLIKPLSDLHYKEILNKKIKGLNLTKDASEFRKTYKRLLNYNVELQMKTLLSQLSQNGKLGK